MSSISSLNSLLSSTSSSSPSGIDISSLLAAATGATSTGIDVTSAVDAAIYAEQAPERQWQTEQSTLQSQITAVGSVQAALTALSADLDNLNDVNGALAARDISSSDSSAVTATADSSAAIGNHVVTVQKLATSATWYSSPLATGDGSLGTSTLTITQNNGVQTSFALGTAGLNSLSSLATAINSDNLGVNATVVEDATGSRLALVSNSSGANSNYTVSDGSSSGSSWSSASVASASSTLSSGSLQINDGTSTAAITINAGSTLTDVADQINNMGLSLTASVVSDPSGAHLSVTGGQGNDVSVSSDPTLALTQSSIGSNASLSVDGVPVTSTSNTVTGVIPGVTLSLQSVTSGGQVTLNVAADSGQITSAVSQFVSDYNSAVNLVNSQFAYSTSSGGEGVLGNDAALRSLQNELLQIGGYTSSSGGQSASSINSLQNLGIAMNDDGTLSLSTSNLQQAVIADPSAVQDFFQGQSSDGFASIINAQLDSFTDPEKGALTADTNNLTQQYRTLQANINSYQTGYIASQQTLLTAMYSKAEIALQQLPTTLKQIQAELGQNSGS